MHEYVLYRFIDACIVSYVSLAVLKPVIKQVYDSTDDLVYVFTYLRFLPDCGVPMNAKDTGSNQETCENTNIYFKGINFFTHFTQTA